MTTCKHCGEEIFLNVFGYYHAEMTFCATPEPTEAEKAWESWKFAVKFADDKVEALTKCAYLAAWQEARESKSSSSS